MLECKAYSGFASGPIWWYSELVPKLPSFFLTPLPRYGVKAGHVTTTKMVCPKNPATALFDTAYSFLITWFRDAKKTIVAWNSNWSSFLLFYSNLGNQFLQLWTSFYNSFKHGMQKLKKQNYCQIGCLIYFLEMSQ